MSDTGPNGASAERRRRSAVLAPPHWCATVGSNPLSKLGTQFDQARFRVSGVGATTRQIQDEGNFEAAQLRLRMSDRISTGHWVSITLADPPSPWPSCVAPFRWLLPLISSRPATRPPIPALAPEGSPDQPGHPIDEHWREPNGEHHQPRLRPLKAGHRPRPPPAGSGYLALLTVN